MGQKKVSFEVEMHVRVGARKSVLFREVSSIRSVLI